MKERKESMFEKAEKNENLWTRYDFNEAELKTMARDLSEALTKKKNLEDDLKSAVASFKSDIAEKVAKINKLSNLYGTGYESRNMPCEVFYNWEMDIKRFVRVDNGEIVKEEKIPEVDRQMKIKETEEREDNDNLKKIRCNECENIDKKAEKCKFFDKVLAKYHEDGKYLPCVECILEDCKKYTGGK